MLSLSNQFWRTLMATLIHAFVLDQRGAAAIQYALIAGVLSVAVLSACFALRGELVDLYQGMSVQANQALGGNPEG
jgi:Flp pilus assembly pilin Flp